MVALFPASQATLRFYLAAVEKNRIFLHSCEIKSGSGVGTRLGRWHTWLDFPAIAFDSQSKQPVILYMHSQLFSLQNSPHPSSDFSRLCTLSGHTVVTVTNENGWLAATCYIPCMLYYS